MNKKPRCIIVTGRPGAGKSTLAKKLGEKLWLPVVSRDVIKEGYVQTFGHSHQQLPPETNQTVSTFFFELVGNYLANHVSIVIEAAFQHHVWAAQRPKLQALSHPLFVICEVPAAVAAGRHLRRKLAEPKRAFFHGDSHVPEAYLSPEFDLPTMTVSTARGYAPSLDALVQRILNEKSGF